MQDWQLKLKSDRLWALLVFALAAVANALFDLGLEDAGAGGSPSPLMALLVAVLAFTAAKTFRPTSAPGVAVASVLDALPQWLGDTQIGRRARSAVEPVRREAESVGRTALERAVEALQRRDVPTGPPARLRRETLGEADPPTEAYDGDEIEHR